VTDHASVSVFQHVSLEWGKSDGHWDWSQAFPEIVLDDRFARTQPDFDWLGPKPDAAAAEPHQQWRGSGPILCNFNSEWRVTPPAWSVWMNLLRRLGPGSQETSAKGATRDATTSSWSCWVPPAYISQSCHLTICELKIHCVTHSYQR
jgi:hypothetical protein